MTMRRRAGKKVGSGGGKAAKRRKERVLVTLDDWRALVLGVVRARTAGEAREVYERYKSDGREWELPVFLEVGEEEIEVFARGVNRVLDDRLKEVKAGGELWSVLLALRDEVFDS